MAFTAAAKATMIDAVMQGTIYVSLHSGDPSTTGANELSGNGYARQLVEFTAADGSGNSVNTNVETFGPSSGADWTQATYFGLWSAVTGGTFKGGFALTTPRTITATVRGEFAAGALVAHV